MMGADASLHADQARWQVGKSRLHLATRPFLPQYDRTTPIVPYGVERVLADIDADHRDCAIGLLRHGVLLVFAAQGSVSITGGAGARPDHPIRRHSRRVAGNWRADLIGVCQEQLDVLLQEES